MKLAVYLAVLSVAAFSSALATEPPPAAPSAASSTTAPVVEVKPAAAPAAATPAKVEKTEAIKPAATEAEIKQMRGRGYKPVNRNGTLVFCRDEGEIGTHFQRTHCSTLDQLKQAELSGKEYVNSIQQQGSAVPFKGP
jgi:hypothetical protein